eukprot:4423280-Amphidinium_carterae.1
MPHIRLTLNKQSNETPDTPRFNYQLQFVFHISNTQAFARRRAQQHISFTRVLASHDRTVPAMSVFTGSCTLAPTKLTDGQDANIARTPDMNSESKPPPNPTAL